MIKTFFINSSVAEYTDEEFSFFNSIYEAGIFGDSAGTMGLQVIQNGTPDMHVLIGTGKALITLTKSGITWKVVFVNNAQANLTVANNVSGVNRVDAVICRVDKDAEPNALKSNVGTIEIVTGSGITALSDGDITTAVGSDGWYRLANITVANSATTIVTANIADTRVKVTTNNSINIIDNVTTSALPIGAVVPFSGKVLPNNFLWAKGDEVSRATYANLFAVACPSAVFTVTIASPAVFTKVAHGLIAGDKIHFTTTGGLPSGLSANTDYYVLSTSLTADTFKVALSPEGTAVVTTGSQNGVHTFYNTGEGYGKGDGSTTFSLLDMRSKGIIGRGDSAPTYSLSFESGAVDTGADTIAVPAYGFPYQGQKVQLTTTGTLPTGLSTATDYYVVRVSATSIKLASSQSNANLETPTVINITGAGSGVHTMTYTGVAHTVLGQSIGEETHGLSVGELATHNHGILGSTSFSPSSGGGTSYNNGSGTTGDRGGNAQHNIVSPNMVLNYIIRY